VLTMDRVERKERNHRTSPSKNRLETWRGNPWECSGLTAANGAQRFGLVSSDTTSPDPELAARSLIVMLGSPIYEARASPV
jgi:hypothetical protein